MVHWPLPYDGEPNEFEIVGRYIAQTLIMERFVDLILLKQGMKPRDLKRATLSAKIEELRELIDADSELDDWRDIPDRMRGVAQNRNLFAHRLFERNETPLHYRQGLSYERLSGEELRAQEKEAFVVSELGRQLVSKILHGPLNPGVEFGRTEPEWTGR